MAWPEDRLTTYAPGAQIKSADLNEIQDAIIGGKHGEVPLNAGVAGLGVYSGTATWNSSGHALGTFSAFIDLPTPEGAIITWVRVWLKDSVGTTITWQVQRIRMTTDPIGSSTKSDAMVSDASGDVQEMLATALVLESRAAGDRYRINCILGAAGHHLYGAEYGVKLP